MLVCGLVLILCFGLFLAATYRYVQMESTQHLQSEMACIAEGVRLNGADYFEQLNTEDRVTWVAADGTLLYDSATEEQIGNWLELEEIREAVEEGIGSSNRQSSFFSRYYTFYALRQPDGSVLRVSCTQDSVVSIMIIMTSPLLGILILVLVLCAFFAYRLAQQIVRSINQIDLDYPNVDGTYRELTPLVCKIQQQNRTIARQMSELSRKRREFAAITEGMSEGFLLLDRHTNVLSGNRSARALLEQASGQPIENLRRDGCLSEVKDTVELAIAGKRSEFVLEVEDRSWQIIANPVVSHGQVHGVVVLVMDVTEREQRDQLRREFSANVSHELKTPLTSISGFAELIKEGLVPPDKMQEFAGDIYRESQRLMGLVNDILRLSQLDEQGTMPQASSVDLYALSRRVLDRLAPVAEEGEVALTLEGEKLTVWGVERILDEMIYNLCENAIKYNRRAGRVEVNLHTVGGEVVLTVQDTGIGIPASDQPRVFERFFRVDKSHSKAVGGTGLGLSIVKHGAQYHHARVELESRLGEGTKITLYFPPNQHIENTTQTQSA